MTTNTITHDRRIDERRTPEALLRVAATLLQAAGVERSPSWLSRTVRAYLASPVDTMPFGAYLVARVDLNEQQRRRLAERADLRYLLSYRDPTGETAVHNLLLKGHR